MSHIYNMKENELKDELNLVTLAQEYASEDNSVHKEFKAHHTVVHSKYEYILKTPDGISAGTNHCESFFSLLKRGVHGAWHSVSREHLHLYVGEFAFRWNTRKLTDGARMETAIGLTSGKRLTYRQMI